MDTPLGKKLWSQTNQLAKFGHILCIFGAFWAINGYSKGGTSQMSSELIFMFLKSNAQLIMIGLSWLHIFECMSMNKQQYYVITFSSTGNSDDQAINYNSCISITLVQRVYCQLFPIIIWEKFPISKIQVTNKSKSLGKFNF